MAISGFFYFFSFALCGSLFYFGMDKAFTPLLLSFVLAYFFFPVIKKLEKMNIKRELATLGVFLAVLLIMIFLFVFTIPILYKDLSSFINELPNNIQILLVKFEEIVKGYGWENTIDKESVIVLAKKYSSEFGLKAFQSITHFLKGTFSGLAGLFVGILNCFLFPVFFYYVITDFEKYSSELKKILPKHYRQPITGIVGEANEIFSSYFRGQIIVAFILSLLYGLGLGLTGIKFGWVIGICTGVLSLIPYVGLTIGLLSSLIMVIANYQGIGPLLAVVLVFGLIYLLESFILTPKIVGKKVGLNPLFTMLALIIGGNLWGLAGMFVAIPLLGVLKVILVYIKTEYQKTPFYLKG